jgi:hypothetical protein
MIKKFYKISFSVFSIFVFVFFTGRGFSYVRAQTGTKTQQPANQIAGDFKLDVKNGVQQLKNDKEARNNQQEIDNEDSEEAGDEGGDSKEIDGENNQSEIDNEIDQEVGIGEETGDQSSELDNSTSDSSDTNDDALPGNNERN